MEDINDKITDDPSEKCTGLRKVSLRVHFITKKTSVRLQLASMFLRGKRRNIRTHDVQQCGDAPCIKVCPNRRHAPHDRRGVVDWDTKKCIRCRMCTQACPFGNAVYDVLTNRYSNVMNAKVILPVYACCQNKALDFYREIPYQHVQVLKAFASKFKEDFPGGKIMNG